MENLLEQLRKQTTVVVDSGELSSIQQYMPEDATTNPSLILKAISSGEYNTLLNSVISNVKAMGLKGEARELEEISDRLIVAIGYEILKLIPGKVSTEVDARLSFNTKATIDKAKKLVNLYKNLGIDRSRILIKIASTWEGIRAAEQLEKDGINCNLTLLFSFAQARACAEANVFLISPFVGRILDWYKNSTGEQYVGDKDPGVISVKNIFQFYKTYGYKTVVMGASFRNIQEVKELAGCDRLTISPNLLEELGQVYEPLEQKLDAGIYVTPESYPTSLTESEFRWLHNNDAMATEKLAEGIRSFAIDQLKLEDLLADSLA
ncbi:MAG: transaldolase [Vibrio hibernica]